MGHDGYQEGEALVDKLVIVETEDLVALLKAVDSVVNGNPDKISSPLGPLHVYGMQTQWEADVMILSAPYKRLKNFLTLYHEPQQ